MGTSFPVSHHIVCRVTAVMEHCHIELLQLLSFLRREHLSFKTKVLTNQPNVFILNAIPFCIQSHIVSCNRRRKHFTKLYSFTSKYTRKLVLILYDFF